MSSYKYIAVVTLAVVAVVAGYIAEARTKRQAAGNCTTRPESCRNVAGSKPRVKAILSSGIEVMCDTQTDGGGWTVFQRRVTGALLFNRGWEEYKYGFGDIVTGEFYLGNENIHQITRKRRFELRIDFAFNKANYFAKYSRFRLYGEPEGYRLKLGDFTGNAGDSFSIHNDAKFVTFDRDKINNNKLTEKCAEQYKGGWWYQDCHKSNFNGIWAYTVYGEGLNWHTLTNYNQSVTMTEMKFREI